MSKMQVPGRVKQIRFTPKSVLTEDHAKIAALEYLINNLESIVSSEKYVLCRNILVLNTKPTCDKLRLKMALETISKDGNKVVKVASSVRKPVAKNFRGTRGTESGFKRMCVTMTNPFDLSVFFGGEDA